MLTYAEVQRYLSARMDPDLNLSWFPAYTDAARKTSGKLVFLSVGGGAGLRKESVFDRPFISVRACGMPQDYASAEDLALQLDAELLAFGVDSPVSHFDTTYGLYVTRSGGRPSFLTYDSGERYHFQASYITETESGL